MNKKDEWFSDLKVNNIKDAIYKSHKLLLHLKDSFPTLYKEHCKFIDKQNEYSTIEVVDLMMLLIFGSDRTDNNISKKMDFNKNKAFLKMILLNTLQMDKIETFMYEFVDYARNTFIRIQNAMESVEYDRNNFDNEYMNVDEYQKITQIVEASIIELHSVLESIRAFNKFTWRSELFTDLNKFKKDTLKRYYFNYTYELKNHVMLFDKDKYVFGEINSIMRNFNRIFDFIFGDFIGIYHTLLTNLETFRNDK